ncbi:TraX family protein [Vagococcus hydrophili]|uniref:Fimbrial assembly protein fimC n=1 Tax=Vagococcus hydrophili TaxID=2714947 RepID=A0A6G8ASM5_9ENTE|nr:TraX family protein [Vagococcus hydrophili]QIL48078.1 fimbrial assembly protein fimC [Vagococcus hydrophili]
MERKINAFHLKIIAIVAMLINHIGQGFSIYEYNHFLFFSTEFIGKLTFPIMAYLLVEGFYYTKNLKKYMLRMALFWVISIYPFHLLHAQGTPFEPIELVNNIFFTLLMGLLMLRAIKKITNKGIRIFIVIVFSLLTAMSDWSVVGIFMIYGFYIIKDPKRKIISPCFHTTFFLFLIMLMGAVGAPDNVMWYMPITALGIFLVIPLLLNYNGERGLNNNFIKWGFYLFYPLHTIVLVLIRNLI